MDETQAVIPSQQKQQPEVQLPENTTPQPEKKKLNKWLIIGLISVSLIILGFIGIFAYNNYQLRIQLKPKTQSINLSNQKTQNTTTISTNYSDFQEDINDNLNINLEQIKYFDDYVSSFDLTEEARQNLSKYGFTVEKRKRGEDEFFDQYQANNFNHFANFITTDSVLHLLHKNVEYLVKRSEENKLLPLLETIINSGLTQTKTQYSENPSSSNKIAYSYFLIGAKLLNLEVSVPAELQENINQEMNLIQNGNQIIKSVVMNLDNPSNDKDIVKMDYSQFKVRGYYTENDNLKRYFKGYMWLSLPTINLQTERGMSLSQHLAKIILANQQAIDSYKRISSFISFFTNISSNVSLDTMNKLNIVNINDLSTNLQTLLNNKNNPLETDDRYLQFSYFPRASMLDNYIFQNNEKDKIAKLFPSTIEIPVVFGSEEAKDIAKKIGFDQIYNNNEYFSTLETLKDTIINNQDNLYSKWMKTLNPLLNYSNNDFIFSRTRAWLRKELVTYISSWTELKHSMILYAEMRGAGGGGEPPERDDRGLVEPYPEVYQGISSNINFILNHFQNNNLLDANASQDFKDLQTFVQEIYKIALKEVNKQTLTNDDYDFIRNYGGGYQKLWLNTFTEEQIAKSGGFHDLMYDNPAAIVADIYADESGQILHSGNGFAQRITVVFELEGEMRFASGIVYSNYEFKQQNERLTDEEWRTMLRSNTKDENYMEIQNTPWQSLYQHNPSSLLY